MLDTTPTSQMVDENGHMKQKKSHFENSKCYSESAKSTVEPGTFIPWCKAQCAGRGVPHGHSFFKKSLHSDVRLEGLSFPGDQQVSKHGGFHSHGGFQTVI